jgi:membrane-associated protease RseP (regulator of RpoE activity)
MSTRTTVMRPALLVLFCLSGVWGLPATAQAQLRGGEPDGFGWIGISFEVEADRWGRAHSVMVTDVMAGSPARDAGVRPGDRLLAVNEFDTPGELEQLAERLRLRVGDRVVMEIERAGERRRLQLTATQRPDDARLGRRVEVAWAEGDPVEAWVRSMDSLRVEIVREGGGTVQVRAMSPGRPERLTVVGADGPGSVRAPFEFFVFRGEAYDSLRAEMVELNRTMEELRQRVARRGAELARGGQPDRSTLVGDEEARRLSQLIDQAALRSAALEVAMAEDARRTAGLEQAVRPTTPISARGRESGTGVEAFSPLTPYLLGRNRVAGAEVVALRPELADYFSVASGVLVVDVAPGTPAALAGLVPGDVVTRIDEMDIRTVDALRLGVSGAEGPVALTLTRKGATLQLLLSR